MIKIAITLDDVLRNKTSQFGKIYKKYINKDIDLSSIDTTTNDLCVSFGFKTKSEYNKFLYEDYAFEIFAEASTVTPSLDKKLNLWHLSLNNHEEIDEELSLSLCNPMEFNASIGFTHFFLSKMATRVRETFFPCQTAEIWDKCDILITADPNLLKCVPQNKVCIKIEQDYNKNISGDNIISFSTLEEFINDKDNLLTAIRHYQEIR